MQDFQIRYATATPGLSKRSLRKRRYPFAEPFWKPSKQSDTPEKPNFPKKICGSKLRAQNKSPCNVARRGHARVKNVSTDNEPATIRMQTSLGQLLLFSMAQSGAIRRLRTGLKERANAAHALATAANTNGPRTPEESELLAPEVPQHRGTSASTLMAEIIALARLES